MRINGIITFMIYQDDKEETASRIRNVLRSYNREFFTDSETINLFEEIDGSFIGGLTATRDFDSIYIDYFVVEEKYRKSGIGRKLLTRLEEIAKEKNVKRIMLNTYSFQSPYFYEKMGYKPNLIIDPVFSNYKHYHFIKEL